MKEIFRRIFNINSVNRRLRVAFMSIVLLLFFSGAISLLELERVSHDTEEILLASKQNVDIAGEMISALKEQDDAMIHMAVMGRSFSDITTYGVKCEESITRLYEASQQAHRRMLATETPSATDSLVLYTNRINGLANDFLSGNVLRSVAEIQSIDSTSTYSSRKWYIESYKPEYMNLSEQITKYMTGSQSTLGPDVNRLSHTARRAVTPVFISVVVMLVVVLMLYYFLHVYFIRPVLRINRNLGDYLNFRMPFESDPSCRDEIATLRERISTLIDKLK